MMQAEQEVRQLQHYRMNTNRSGVYEQQWWRFCILSIVSNLAIIRELDIS
jgi:hypothetical protein